MHHSSYAILLRLLVLVLLIVPLSACSLVSYIVAPSEVKVTMEIERPLHGSMTDFHRLAIAHPELIAGAGATERTQETKSLVEVNLPAVIAMTEELQKNKRFTILTPTEFASAFDKNGKSPFRTGLSAMTTEERKQAYKMAGQALNVDGIIVIDVGALVPIRISFLRAMMGDARMETVRNLTMKVIDTKTGNEVWRQKGVAYYFVNDPSVADTKQFPILREELAKNFEATTK